MKTYFRRVVVLSVLAMLYTAISNANLGIISQFASQNGNKWVGPTSIGLVFLGSGTGALYNEYIGKWRYRFILFFGAMGWNIFLAFSVIFLFIGFSELVIVIILTGSLFCGFLLSIYYNGLNNYVNECGKHDDKVNSYFGLNICIVQCANIVGNALSEVLIKPLGQREYSFVMLGANIALSLFYLFAKEFPKDSSQLQQYQKSIIEEQKNHEQQTLIAKNEKTKIPKLLFFTFAFSGIMISFVYSELSISFYKYYQGMEDEELNKLTFFTSMIEGCGEFLGGLILALFASKMKNVVFYYFLNGLLFIGSTLIMWQGFEQKQKIMINIAAFLIGFADCFGFAIALAISGKWDQSGISLFNFGQSLTVAMLSALYIFLGIPYVIIVYGAYLILSTFASVKYRSIIENVTEETRNVQ